MQIHRDLRPVAFGARGRTVETVAAISWRPAVASVRNLGAFWATLAVAAATSTAANATSSERRVAFAVLAVSAAGAFLVTATWGRTRVRAALDNAEQPRVANWPPSEAELRRRDAAARADAIRAGLVGLGVGLVAGFVPVIGAVIAATAVAGAIGSWSSARIIGRFESERQVAVLMPSRRDLGRAERRLLFGALPVRRCAR